MMSVRFSRRRLLGSVLAALIGWLMPQRSRTRAAPPRSKPPALHDADPYPIVAIYSYDGSDQLYRATDYSPDGAENGRWPCQYGAGELPGNHTASIYDGRPSLASESQADP